MTREEINKAIENGESVWVVDLKNKTITENKRHKHFKKLLATQRENRIPFDRIFTTRRQAEHYLHHANVERVEKLPFLAWEEFDKGDRLIRFTGKNGEKCKLEGYQKDDKQSGFIDVVVNGTGSNIDFDYTEADFYKAYDECVRLFKGGGKE